MNVKTIILIIIVILIAIYAFRNLYRTFTGKGGCACGGGGDDHGKHHCSGGCSCCGTHNHEDKK